MGLIVSLILWIVGLLILYFVIRAAVREGILAAWRIRDQAEKEVRDDKSQGW